MSTVAERAAQKMAATNREPQRPSVEPLPKTVNIRTGEDSLTSRPVYLSNLAGFMTGRLDKSMCKPELDMFGWFTKAMKDFYGSGYTHEDSYLVPLSWKGLPSQVRHASEAVVFRKAMSEAGDHYDPDELRWMFRKSSDPMSYLDAQTGGSFVPPPAFGEPIELLRNKAACMEAGATQVPLPPQGSITYPRQTTASESYWEGENTDNGAESKIGTGDITLTAKQLKCFVRVPNQWLRFAPGSANALVNNDITRTLGLKIDKAALEGPGGAGIPKGLLSFKGDANGINNYTGTLAGSGTANDPYILRPADGDRMVQMVEEDNQDGFNGWVMSPGMWRAGVKQLRADAVTAGDNSGTFLFDITRQLGQALAEQWLGYKVTRSTQVATNRTRGSATGLSYIMGGYWPDLLIGMHGALELVANDRGDEAFKKNQTLIRGIAFSDVNIRHGGSFVVYDQLRQNV